MSSETSMTKAKTVFKHEEHNLVILSLLNASGGTLYPGQEVNIKASTNNSVEKRDAGTDFPLGIVTVGGADGAYVSVATILQRTCQAIAKGGTLAAGVFAKPNGTYNAAGLPEYVVTAVSGDYVSAVVISGGAVDTEVRLGILRAPFKI
jgi:hypothetical protein